MNGCKMEVKKLEKLYEGKAKIIYRTDNPDLIIQEFKDEATAFDGKKKGIIKEKGVINAKISSELFQLLDEAGISTHFVEFVPPREMVVIQLKMVPLEVIVRNLAAGSLSKRLGYKEGFKLKNPIVEYYYKNDELGDPLLTVEHIQELGVAGLDIVEKMKEMALQINMILREFFGKRNLELVDFKLEFGLKNSELILADEITPDTCRLWDTKTKEKMDKDRFRRDLGSVEEAYEEVLRRVKS